MWQSWTRAGSTSSSASSARDALAPASVKPHQQSVEEALAGNYNEGKDYRLVLVDQETKVEHQSQVVRIDLTFRNDF